MILCHGTIRENSKQILKDGLIKHVSTPESIELCGCVTRFVIGALTGIEKAKTYANIDDWKGTLDYVRLGIKDKDIEIKAQTEKFIAENFIG